MSDNVTVEQQPTRMTPADLLAAIESTSRLIDSTSTADCRTLGLYDHLRTLLMAQAALAKSLLIYRVEVKEQP